MQKKTLGWETSTEKMAAHDEVLHGNVPMFLKLEGGGRHRCDFRTTYEYVVGIKDESVLLITRSSFKSVLEQAEAFVNGKETKRC